MTRPQRGSALAVDYRQVLSGPDLGTGSSADELDDEHRAASSDAENVDPLAPNSMQTAQVRKEGARDTTTVSHGIKRQRMDGGSSESDAAESEDDEYKASSSSSEASEGVVEDEDSSASGDAQEEPSDDESVVSMAGAVDQQEADAVPVPASTIDLHRRLSRFINALLIACLRSSVATGLSMMEPDRANQKQFRTKKGEDMDASAAAAHSSDLPVPTGDRLLIAMPDVVTGLHECCIPGCPKQFKVFPSVGWLC